MDNKVVSARISKKAYDAIAGMIGKENRFRSLSQAIGHFVDVGLAHDGDASLGKEDLRQILREELARLRISAVPSPEQARPNPKLSKMLLKTRR